MVASRKRGRQQVAQEEGQISIRLADNITLSAKANILRTCSSCAEGLPADAQEWDLSQLLVEGDPVTKETAVAWLNSAYQRILDSEFEKQREDVRCSATGVFCAGCCQYRLSHCARPLIQNMHAMLCYIQLLSRKDDV